MPVAETQAAILGCAGLSLSEADRRFFATHRPAGFILFARNVGDPDQVRALVKSLRETVEAECPVLIDQEGGRVQRLRPPHWRAYPAGAAIARAGIEAARLGARLIAADLAALGIDVDCLPVLDVPVPGAHDVIGDRAYGHAPETVIRFGDAVCDGLLEGGVTPVIKHVPGHGRAAADSHTELPVVDAPLAALEAADFLPFRTLNHAPWAMTAHVVYRALDTLPATLSPKIIRDVIRGWMGFDGVLVSDDLGMNALSGDFADRARGALSAGCDLALHCSGKMDEMEALLPGLSPLTDRAARRLARADALRRDRAAKSTPLPPDAWDQLSALLQPVRA